MADKKSPASGWPKVKGDFISGDANSPVAIVTMGSHLDEKGLCDAGAAMCGSCKTENLGLEKVIANIIANPNIRFMLCCGNRGQRSPRRPDHDRSPQGWCERWQGRRR